MKNKGKSRIGFPLDSRVLKRQTAGRKEERDCLKYQNMSNATCYKKKMESTATKNQRTSQTIVTEALKDCFN